MTNIFSDNARFMWESYGAVGDCAGFIYDQTNLFTHPIKKEPFIPYPKQVEFMNLLNANDRVIVVLKIRQCVHSSTLINLGDGNFEEIGDLYKSNYKGKCLSFDLYGNLTEDYIEEVWESGKKLLYKITLQDNTSLICSRDHKIFTEKRGFIKLSELKHTDKIRVLDYYSSKSYSKYLSIKSIVEYGEEKTYDLRTRYNHSFIGNSIHVHNSGFSTAIVGLACFKAYFGLIPEIAILSASSGQAEKVLERIRATFMSMHESLRPEFVKDSKNKIQMKNGTVIYSLSSNPDTARGFTGDVFLDEFGVLPVNDSYKIWTATYPTTTLGGRIIAVSTPKGDKGKFYDLATKSLAELSGGEVHSESKKYKISVDDVPHIKHARDFEGLFNGLTPEEVAQEYGLTFFTDKSESFFSKDFIMSNFISRDITLPLFTSYEEIGLPENAYFEPLKYKNDPEFFIKNNEAINYLHDVYSEFYFGWDIAKSGDESMLTISGLRRSDKLTKDCIFEMDVKKCSNDTLIQADHVSMLANIFSYTGGCSDATGIGQGATEKLIADDLIGERWHGVEFYNVQNKINLYNQAYNDIMLGKFKRNFDGSRYDQSRIDQMQNIFIKGGRLVDGGKKSDYPSSVVLNINASKLSKEGGFHIIKRRI